MKKTLPLSFETPQQAIESIENTYRMKDKSKILLCKDFILEAKFISPDEPYQMGPGKVISKEDLTKVRILNASLFKTKYMYDLNQEGIPDCTGVTYKITNIRRITDDMTVISEDISGRGQFIKSELFVGKNSNGKWKVLMEYSKEMEDNWIKYYGTK